MIAVYKCYNNGRQARRPFAILRDATLKNCEEKMDELIRKHPGRFPEPNTIVYEDMDQDVIADLLQSVETI